MLKEKLHRHWPWKTVSSHFHTVGSQLLQGWIWLVLANVRWRWWQPIRDHCFSGRVSLTATNITRPTLDFIEEIYQFLCTVSGFVHRTRITFDRRGDCGLRERRRERRDRKKRSWFERKTKRSFVCIEEEEGVSRFSQTQRTDVLAG